MAQGFAKQIVINESGGGGTPGGSSTNVQYNLSGAFAGDAGLTYDAAGNLTVGSSINVSNGTYTVKIQDSTSQSTSYTLTLPPNAGTSGYVLQTDGTGVLTWVAASGGIGGSTGSTNNALLTANGTGGSTLQATSATLEASALNLPTGYSYSIAGTSVLNATTLGSGVTTSSLTSVGTVTSGTWNSTTIATAHGGTGLTSFTSDGLFYASSTSAVSQVAVVDNGVLVTNASGVPSLLANGTAGYVLTAQSGAAPAWAANAAAVAGSNTQIQYNNSGTFGASAALSFQSGTLVVGAPSTVQGELLLYSSSSNYHVSFTPSSSQSANTSYILPTTAGTSGYVLQTDGTGTLSWVAQSGGGGGGTPGGSNTQVQFNSSGSFGADSGFTYAGTGTATLTTQLTIGGNASTAGVLALAETSGNGSNTVGFIAPASISSNVQWTLPSTDGTSGQVMQTNGTGTLSWITPSAGTPGGSNTQIQYNNAGSFAGDAGFKYLGSGFVEASSTVAIGGASSTVGALRLLENPTNGANYIGFQAPASISSNLLWTLPSTDGTSGQVMQTNGTGTLSWITPSGSGIGGSTGSTSTAIIIANGTGGSTVEASAATLSTAGTLNLPSSQAYEINGATVLNATTLGSGVTTSSLTSVGTVTSGTWNSTLGSTAQAGITQTGTITSGTWNGTTIATAHGGTGLTSFTSDGLFYASSSSAVSQVAVVDNGVLVTNASGVPSLLANGTAGQVLTAQSGAPPAWAAASGGGNWTKITRTSASASASVVFSSLTSTYQAYCIILSNVLAATASQNLQLTFNSITSAYQWCLSNINTGAIGENGSTSDTKIVLNSTGNSIATSGPGYSAVIWLYAPDTTNPQTVTWTYFQNASGNTMLAGMGAGQNTGTTAVTSITFAMSSGNITSGIFEIYGITA